MAGVLPRAAPDFVMPPTLGPRLPLSSILPILPQILSAHPGPLLTQLLCQKHVCLSLPSPLFHKSNFKPSSQAQPPAVSYTPLLHVHTHRTSLPLTLSPPLCFHQKDEEAAFEGRTRPESPASPAKYWLSHLGKITLLLRASVFFVCEMGTLFGRI